MATYTVTLTQTAISDSDQVLAKREGVIEVEAGSPTEATSKVADSQYEGVEWSYTEEHGDMNFNGPIELKAVAGSKKAPPADKPSGIV